MKEEDAWHNCHPDDAWVFDKLVLSRKLGYICGPADVAVPESNYYVVRPCVNLAGMSIGAEIQYLEIDTWIEQPGYFWCEMFKGRHLSADYEIDSVSRSIQQGLTVEGFRDLIGSEKNYGYIGPKFLNITTPEQDDGFL